MSDSIILIPGDETPVVVSTTNASTIVSSQEASNVTVDTEVDPIIIEIQVAPELVINPNNAANVQVRPVNNEVLILPTTVTISLDGNTTNFAIAGDTTVEITAPAATIIQAFDLVVQTSTGLELADASNLSHFALATGFAKTTVLAGQNLTALIDGKITNPSWTFTPGDYLFMSTTPGTIVNIPDVGSVFIKRVGYVVDSTTIFVHQDSDPVLT